MKAWQWDANSIQTNDLDTRSLGKQIVYTKAIESFLTTGWNDSKFFIVAPKGVGKTLLLKAKSQLYRDRASGYTFIPQTELCEKFSALQTSFSRAEAEKFGSQSVWNELWELALLALILRRFKIDLPAEVVAAIGEAEELGEIFFALLQRRSAISALYGHVATAMRPRLKRLGQESEDGVGQVAVFIDNVDEAFQSHTGQSLASGSPGDGAKSDRIWTYAQLGLMEAVRGICFAYRHIKIFACIRAEAYEISEHVTKLQGDLNCTFLKYSRRDVERIFRRNVELMSGPDLAVPDAKDPVERFLGATQIEHRFAKKPDNEPRLEDLFGYLYRHTLGRPRELLLMGEQLSQLDPGGRTPDQVRGAAQEVAETVLKQYQREIVPFFDHASFSAFCSQARHNVIPRSRLHEIESSLARKHQTPNFGQYLYGLGLLGVVQGAIAGTVERIQFFEPAGHHSRSHAGKMPPRSEFFLLHPVVDGYLRQLHDVTFWDHNNIIGPGYGFQGPSEAGMRPVQVHVGLDTESLSLIIPESCSGRSMAIMVPVAQQWRELAQADRLELTGKWGGKYAFAVIHDGLSPEEMRHRIREWSGGRTNCVVYTRSSSLAAEFFGRASVLSFGRFEESEARLLHEVEFGAGQLSSAHLLDRLHGSSKVRHLRSVLSDRGASGCTVTEAFADRVVRGVKVTLDGNVLRVHTDAAHDGELILRAHAGDDTFASERVTLCAKDYALKFHKYKYLYLREGVRAYMALIRERAEEIRRGLVDPAFELFVDIQVRRLRKKSPRVDLVHEVADLVAYCHRVRSSTENHLLDVLSSAPPLLRNVKTYRRRAGVLPRRREFYEHSRQSTHFKNTEAVKFLIDLLGVKFRAGIKSVFVSYSFKDSRFATRLADALLLRGIKTFLFGHDNPAGALERTMVSKLREHEVLLFVASKDSLLSEACNFELAEARRRHLEEWGESIIAVRLDDFVLKLQPDEVPASLREVVWSNVLELRRTHAVDFSRYAGSGRSTRRSTRQWEDAVDSLVRTALSR